MPEDVPETFEAFAKILKRSLLSYQNQADVYYRACLTEFQEQLKQFQKELPHVTHLAVNCLLNEHQQKLLCSTTKILQNFKTQMKVWEDMK
ncbi:CC180 protein, partial [Alcedo cyanopectus]|nr:CC180 protein [Ceyx cyanopectus]